MKNMTLERITEVCGGVYYGSEADRKKEITGAVIDSRQVEPGYLFIAVRGEKGFAVFWGCARRSTASCC